MLSHGKKFSGQGLVLYNPELSHKIFLPNLLFIELF